MPLLFAISGASSWFALRSRKASAYLLERITRLLVPALFGVVFLIPSMTYLTRLWLNRSAGFWQHYTGFFRINPDDLPGLGGTFTPAHLWFLFFLFVFSVLALPVFLGLRSRAGQKFSRALANIFSSPVSVIFLALPLALAASFDILGDKNPLHYFMVFILGFVLMTDERYQRAIDRAVPFTLVIGVVFELLRQTWDNNYADWSPLWLVYGLMEQFNRWIWVLAMLGLGHRYLNRTGPALRYLSASSFPFYVLHLPLMTLVTFWVVPLDLPVAVQYLLIVASTCALSFILYEAIRRIPYLRQAFGIRERKKQSAPRPTVARA
jgi:surface polysaccharide O-acyltransferase-like enzyme